MCALWEWRVRVSVFNGYSHIYLYHIAYPRRTIVTQHIQVIEGSSITLPCNVQRPFLNRYTVTWIVNGGNITLPSGQFDLDLTNVPLSYDNTVYTCHVETSIDEPVTGAAAVTAITLTVIQIPHSKLLVTMDVSMLVTKAQIECNLVKMYFINSHREIRDKKI